MHSTDPKFRPSDHMMWNTSSVHPLVTGRMHGVSVLHLSELAVCSKELGPIIVYIQITQTTILEMCSGTWCMSLVCKLHYLLFHVIILQGEETMTAAGISCWWCFKLSFCTMSVKDFDQFFLSEHLDISIQFSCPVMNATVSSLFKIPQIYFFFLLETVILHNLFYYPLFSFVAGYSSWLHTGTILPKYSVNVSLR